MSDFDYTDKELKSYFSNPNKRRKGEGVRSGDSNGDQPDRDWPGFLGRIFNTPKRRQAAVAIGSIALIGFAGLLILSLYFLSFSGQLPDISEIDNPKFQLATVAYTADGVELQRYARQNRSWVTFKDISPMVIEALVATEDHRFYRHWGIDLFRTFAIPYHVLRGDPQGGSTLSQQLARNLYNEQIGREVTVERKLKEMVTAVQLERRYSKDEIIEMYLNTVEFSNNAFGIDAAARTFFGKDPIELDTLESATLVGMQKAITRYNPIRNPENSRKRRNVVLGQMIKHDILPASYLEENREKPVETRYNSSEITEGIAPHASEAVRQWLNDFCKSNGCDPYADGLTVYTTIDSHVQRMAQEALQRQMDGLQAVVDYEWSRPTGYEIGHSIDDYLKREDTKAFDYFWSSKKDVVQSFMRETRRYKSMRKSGKSDSDVLAELRVDSSFVDSLRASKTRLEAGLVSIDPHNGHIRAWIGGRDLAVDWYDHVALAKRQPGSTFKPFVYTAAIDNGYSPYNTLRDTTFTYVDPDTGDEWSPQNMGFSGTGEDLTLREGLAQSNNIITGRLILLITPKETAQYARLMGIESKLDEVPSLALGVSEVSLLEMTSAFSTLANRGLYNEPTLVTRVEDKYGIVIYESAVAPQEALSERTAVIMVDMLRGVIRDGTGRRLNSQFGLGAYDLAGKTGTTQENGDGWFMSMHPELVTGAWVGFNDRRVTFRSEWWGQGAHNALLIVGDFLKQALMGPDAILTDARFDTPNEYDLPTGPLDPSVQKNQLDLQDKDNRNVQGKVGW
ncbi:MAG: transglycosylase domain-containing protein [Bacteroidetes bacterium]|nr:transglycosylase domain-containing protein [Bacteroidota bacterium]